MRFVGFLRTEERGRGQQYSHLPTVSAFKVKNCTSFTTNLTNETWNSRREPYLGRIESSSTNDVRSRISLTTKLRSAFVKKDSRFSSLLGSKSNLRHWKQIIGISGTCLGGITILIVRYSYYSSSLSNWKGMVK